MSAGTETHAAREFRAVCKTCGKKMSWRESFEQAHQDSEEHKMSCWTVTAARDYEPTKEPNLSVECREVEA
jgi:hypothetical protein